MRTRYFFLIILSLASQLILLKNSNAAYYQFRQGTVTPEWDYSLIFHTDSLLSEDSLCHEMKTLQPAYIDALQNNLGFPAICSQFNGTMPAGVLELRYTNTDFPNLIFGAFVYEYISTQTCPDEQRFINNTQECIIGNDSTKGQGEPECPQCIKTEGGNPIHLGTGNKFQTETDYVSNQQGGLRYRRYYNSYGDGLPTRYGNGWSADYWQRIVPISATEMEVRRPDGKYYRFNLVNNVWTPDGDVVLQLEELTDAQSQRTGWLLTLANDTVEEYNSINDVGRPIAITTRNGLTTTLEYELTVAEGFDGLWNSLDRVTDPYGRTLEFYYDTNAHLVTVKDPAGNEITYTRDSNSDNLTSVIYPDDTPLDSNDNPTRVYHYEDSNYPNALTGITDETGNRFATWAYDAQGRAILSEHANGAERIDIVYNNDGTTTVTESNGSTRTYTFETILGVVKPAQISGDKCSTCGSDIESVTYDANGYPTSETDYNGNVTNFTYDARGLQTSRTEAVGTAEERTITTEWHPTLRLPTKITEPGKITNFTYDAQGRLLERKEENAQ